MPDPTLLLVSGLLLTTLWLTAPYARLITTALVLILAASVVMGWGDLAGPIQWIASVVATLAGMSLLGHYVTLVTRRRQFCEEYLSANKGDIAEARTHWLRTHPSQEPPRMTRSMEAWRLAWIAGYDAGRGTAGIGLTPDAAMPLVEGDI